MTTNSMKKLSAILRIREMDQLKKRKLRVFVATVALMLIYGLIISIAPKSDKRNKEKSYNEFMNATVDSPDVLNGLLDNDAVYESEEAYYVYNDNMLGIDNNIALAGKSIQTAANKDYFNSLKDYSACLKGDSLVLISNGTEKMISENADEPILTVGKLFFIDKASNGRLTCYDIDSGYFNAISDVLVEQYALYGSYVVYLGDDWNLYKYSISTKQTIELAPNIQRFFAGSKIIAQNGENIISVSLDGNRYEVLIKNAILEGYDHQKVYFVYINDPEDPNESAEVITDTGIIVEGADSNDEISLDDGKYAVYVYDYENGSIAIVDEINKMIHSVYVIDGKVIIDSI